MIIIIGAPFTCVRTERGRRLPSIERASPQSPHWQNAYPYVYIYIYIYLYIHIYTIYIHIHIHIHYIHIYVYRVPSTIPSLPWCYVLPFGFRQMLESIESVNERHRTCWKFDENQGQPTVLKKTPGEKSNNALLSLLRARAPARSWRVASERRMDPRWKGHQRIQRVW